MKQTKLKFNDINSLINNIKNNTINEANAKKKINALNEIKKAEIKNKRLIMKSIQRNHQVIKIYHQLQTNTTKYTKNADVNSQMNQ